MYLDFKHRRKARAGRSNVAWKDAYGNVHDLDFVFEEGGSEERFGSPVAFIETAWRRYTKHSRNKAQEIQGALRPLAETYAEKKPLLGVVLAGEFTAGSLEQLKSHRFNVAHCPYSSIVEAFRTEDVDISWEEDTEIRDLETKVNSLSRLTLIQQRQITQQILDLNADQFNSFFQSLRDCFRRCIRYIRVLCLSGSQFEFNDVSDAVNFIASHDQSQEGGSFVRYELSVKYTNTDEITGSFQDKSRALQFLNDLSG